MEINFENSIKNQLKKNGFLVKKYIVTSIPGHPDLVIKKNGASLELEVKENWKLSSSQKAYSVENYKFGIIVYYVKKTLNCIEFNGIISFIENEPPRNFSSVLAFVNFLSEHYFEDSKK